MPTPPPKPVAPPTNTEEKIARAGALAFVEKILARINGYTYNSRSHVPGGMDSTAFMNALRDVGTFCKARPDWTLEIVRDALGELGNVGTSADEELEKCRRVLRDFEERLGVKIDQQWPHNNRHLQEALQVILKEKDVEQAKERAVERIKDAQWACTNSAGLINGVLMEIPL